MTAHPSARAAAPAALAVVLALVLAACGGSGGDGGQAAAPAASAPSTTPAPPTTATAPPRRRPAATTASASAFAGQKVKLTQVANLEGALAMTAPAGENAVYIAQQAGTIRAIRNGKLDPEPVLDVGAEIISGGEQGLLGLAFSPDRRYLYVNLTNQQSNTSIREYPMRNGRADKAGMRELLQIQDFAPNHNGGEMVFGPDGHLYIGTGDGGGGGDPKRNGQNTNALLGKLLRIDPRPSGGKAYGIPDGNPFASGGGRPEVWAYGLRNPWRFSFDAATGDLWIGDVGQGQWEEVDAQPGGKAGVNYGWNSVEGTHGYEGGSKPDGAVDPVIEYSHDGGACSVIGGTVYRGSAVPGLKGAYVYGDYCAGWVKAVRTSNGRLAGRPRDLGVSVTSLSAFGADQKGELYALSLAGPVYRVTAG
jgi:glucose/arabinose dehydrogenase